LEGEEDVGVSLSTALVWRRNGRLYFFWRELELALALALDML